MKYRNTMLIAISCFAAAVAFGRAPQAPKGIAGKWGTDAAIAHLKDAAAGAAASLRCAIAASVPHLPAMPFGACGARPNATAAAKQEIAISMVFLYFIACPPG